MKIFRISWPLLLLLIVLSCKDEPKNETGTKRVITVDTIAATPAISVNTYAQVDVSPMDMSYFPIDYPKIKMANGTQSLPIVRVIYSRPHLANRRLFSGILKYDEPWRLGANESTEIDFYKPVTIQNKKINAGRFIIYSIPHSDHWTIVLNNNIDTWGLKQDATKDVQRFEIPATTGNPILEYFTMVFEKTETGANLIIGWDDVLAKLPIEF
jgi:hypothetical protein